MKKNMLYGILLLTFVVLIVWLSNKFYQHSQNTKILAGVDRIDFVDIEKQVVEKIIQLKERARTDPGYALNWGRLGMNLYIHNFKQEALPVFKKAATLNPKDFRWGYFLAMTMDDLGSSEAQDWMERSQHLNPYYPPLAIKLGNRYLMNGELEKAKLQFKNVAASDHKVPHAHLGLAKIALREDHLADSQSQLQKALQLAPEYREAHALLADVYRRIGETARAEEEFELMNKLPVRLDLADPVYNEMEAEGVSSFWCQVRANNYLNAGQLDDAEREFKKAVEAKPNAVSYTSLGYVYQRKKQYDQAMEQYQTALKIDPNYVNALNNLAVIYFETGKTTEAIELVKEAMNINPESADSYLNLGTFYRQTGRRAEAINIFRQGWQLAPDDSRFSYQLAWLLAASPEPKLRNGQEALRLVEMIRSPAQINNPSYLDLWAAALAETRQYPQAYDAARRAYVLALLQKKQDLADEIEARQKLYQAQKPYRIK